MDDLERMLAARLREPDAEVPAAVEDAVLDLGREAASGFARRRRLRLVRVAAAAAAILVVSTFVAARLSAPAERPFDVADAWRVAAGLEHDRVRFDLNGDGRVDRADADAMLVRIVALAPPRRS